MTRLANHNGISQAQKLYQAYELRRSASHFLSWFVEMIKVFDCKTSSEIILDCRLSECKIV